MHRLRQLHQKLHAEQHQHQGRKASLGRSLHPLYGLYLRLLWRSYRIRQTHRRTAEIFSKRLIKQFHFGNLVSDRIVSKLASCGHPQKNCNSKSDRRKAKIAYCGQKIKIYILFFYKITFSFPVYCNNFQNRKFRFLKLSLDNRFFHTESRLSSFSWLHHPSQTGLRSILDLHNFKIRPLTHFKPVIQSNSPFPNKKQVFYTRIAILRSPTIIKLLIEVAQSFPLCLSYAFPMALTMRRPTLL